MTEATAPSKKTLISILHDDFSDRVDFLVEDLKEHHSSYMDAAAQQTNLVKDIGDEVAVAGWTCSQNLIEALCNGAPALMALNLDEVTITAPAEVMDYASKPHGTAQQQPGDANLEAGAAAQTGTAGETGTAATQPEKPPQGALEGAGAAQQN